jgi:glutamine cyclotransferase
MTQSVLRWAIQKSALLISPVVFAASFVGCDKAPPAPAASATNEPPRYTYEIVHTFSHDRGAFTQGLFFLDGVLYESTGLNGRSSLRKVELNTGNILRQTNLSDQFFAEGLATMNHKLYQLTWQDHAAFVYDLDTFKLEKQFTYLYEGWGLTTDGQSLILSDGTPQIRFLDPATFEVRHSITATYRGQLVTNLNELEYIKGEIYANVWGSDFIVRIQPATGKVAGVIDFTGLLKPEDRDASTDVLNGIAYDEATDRLFVTGKCWPKLFEVKLKLAPIGTD